MRRIYTAPTLEAAELELKNLDTTFGAQYPGVIDVWRRAWNEFIPFLDYPAELRRIVYTTNVIESINSIALRPRRESGWPDRATRAVHSIGDPA